MRRLFVTGIGTDVGKTVVSAILVEALQADYWKPIQAGNLDESDSLRVRSLISNPVSVIHPEGFCLKTAAAPHLAANIEGISISPDNITLPETSNTLIIEGAGGVLVPLNEREVIADLIKRLDAPVVIVSRNYLGSINHTLLSIEALRARRIKLLGVIFNGEGASSAEDAILRIGEVQCLGRVAAEAQIDRACILRYKAQFSLL